MSRNVNYCLTPVLSQGCSCKRYLPTAIEKHSKFNKNDLELFMSSLIISSHQVFLVMMEEMKEFPFDALLDWMINLLLPYRITIDNHAGAEAAVLQPSKSEYENIFSLERSRFAKSRD